MSSHKSSPSQYSYHNSKQRQNGNKPRSSGSMEVDTKTRSQRIDHKSPDNGRHKHSSVNGRRRGSDDLLDVHHTWDAAGIENKVKSVYIQRHPDLGLGLSIRGGAEHGIGIYVSAVEPGSVADRHGLCAGDQILSLNGVAFTNIPHQHAAEMIGMCEILDMEVRCVGRIPGSYESLQTYTWMDPGGRMVSPPPEVDRVSRYDLVNRGPIILKEADERKVNIILGDGDRLGFLIRGGREFGLGIYITGVDRGSLADTGGIKPGDQILDVNGHSFLDVSHVDAVKVLKSSHHLILTVKDVGKIPHTHSTHSSMHWDEVQPSYGQAGFVKGVGSQVMHTSLQPTQWSLLQDKASKLLSSSERELLMYYLKGYDKRLINIDALSLALLELLENPQKLSLMSDIRCFIRSQDTVVFDDMALNRYSPQVADSRENSFQNRQMSASKSNRQSNNPKLDVLRSPSDDSGVDVNSGHMYTESQHRVSYLDQQQSYHTSPHELGYSSHTKEPLRHRRSYPGVQPSPNDSNMLSQYQAGQVDRRHSVNNDLWKKPEHSDSEMYGKYHSNDPTGTYESDYSTDLDVYNHGDVRQPVRPPRKKTHFRNPRSTKSTEMNNGSDLNGWHQQRSDSQYHRSRPGILKDGKSSNHSKRERVPCIRIENWEDMKTKLERNMPPELKQTEPTQKPKKEGRQYRQKYRLTPDEMTILKLKVRVKLDELEKKQMLLQLAAAGEVKDTDGSSTKPFSVTQHKLVKPKPVEEIIKENTYDPNKSKASRNVKLTDSDDCHLYSQNWDKKRSEILAKHGGKLEKHESDSFEQPVSKLSTAKTDQSRLLSSPTRSQLKKVTIYKTKTTLGLSIEGGANTKQPLPRIVSIKENGSAYGSELTRGQLILEVNGRSLRDLSHAHCAQTIADAFNDGPSHYVEFLVVDKSHTPQQELTEL